MIYWLRAVYLQFTFPNERGLLRIYIEGILFLWKVGTDPKLYAEQYRLVREIKEVIK